MVFVTTYQTYEENIIKTGLHWKSNNSDIQTYVTLLHVVSIKPHLLQALTFSDAYLIKTNFEKET